MGKGLENAKKLYMEGIRDGDISAVDRYTGDRYTQHSTGVKDGVEGFKEFFAAFIEREPKRDIKVVRGFQDGRYVFVHAAQHLSKNKWVTMDFFDTDEEGKIIEHWDCIAAMVDKTASGRSQTDGPTEPTDLEKTEENKTMIKNFMQDVLIDGKGEKVVEYVSTEKYHQHNVAIEDGLDGLNKALEEMAAKGLSMVYHKVHLLIGCGSFVATLSAMNMAGTDMAAVDLFRIEDGKIVEHWDVLEPILPKEQWGNGGKF